MTDLNAIKAEHKIKTDFIYPPIPVRRFDWCAHYDGEEESGQYGYGTTEAEAVQELLDNYPKEDEPTARAALLKAREG